MGYCYQCDRCHTLIDDTAFDISVTARSIKTGSMRSLAFNLSQSLSPSKSYCWNCIREVEKLLDTPPGAVPDAPPEPKPEERCIDCVNDGNDAICGRCCNHEFFERA